MSNDIEKANTPEKVKFRQSVLGLQDWMVQQVEADPAKSILKDCELAHFFTPIDSKYGCCAYARPFLMPQGSVVIGKIHKHQHLNFIMVGKVSVATEFGKKYFQAPCIFVSEAGLKRAVYAETDVLWVTVHLTKYNTEADLDKIEDEIIAKNYEELGMITGDTHQIGEGK